MKKINFCLLFAEVGISETDTTTDYRVRFGGYSLEGKRLASKCSNERMKRADVHPGDYTLKGRRGKRV